MKVWCVRAASGHYAQNFRDGGYVAVYYEIAEPFPTGGSRDSFKTLYQKYNPDDIKRRAGQNAGQIFRFSEKIQPGHFVITPLSQGTDELYYGKVAGPCRFISAPDDGCDYRHRRKVEWRDGTLLRSDFSQEFQTIIRSDQHTVSEVPYVHFLEYLLHQN